MLLHEDCLCLCRGLEEGEGGRVEGNRVGGLNSYMESARLKIGAGIAKISGFIPHEPSRFCGFLFKYDSLSLVEL